MRLCWWWLCRLRWLLLREQFWRERSRDSVIVVMFGAVICVGVEREGLGLFVVVCERKR